MVINSTWRGSRLTISSKPNCLTLSLQSPGESSVYSFDGEGRLWTAMRADISYRRGLDGKIVAKWQTPGGGRERRWLGTAESDELLASARQVASDLFADLISGALILSPPLDPAGLEFLHRAGAYDPQRCREDITQYNQVYKPVGILPPDQYMAVVLQPAEGCSFNTCTFCTFYRDRRFRISDSRRVSGACRRRA